LVAVARHCRFEPLLILGFLPLVPRITAEQAAQRSRRSRAESGPVRGRPGIDKRARVESWHPGSELQLVEGQRTTRQDDGQDLIECPDLAINLRGHVIGGLLLGFKMTLSAFPLAFLSHPRLLTRLPIKLPANRRLLAFPVRATGTPHHRRLSRIHAYTNLDAAYASRS